MGSVGNFFKNVDKNLRGVPAREAARKQAEAAAAIEKERLANERKATEKREAEVKAKQEKISKRQNEEYNARRRRKIGKASLISTSETGISMLGTQDSLGV